MYEVISGKISYWLYEKGYIIEDEFETYDYIIAMALFAVASVSLFMIVGFMIKSPAQMFLTMIVYNFVLSLLNSESFHANSKSNCIKFTLASLLIIIYLVKFTHLLIPFKNDIPIMTIVYCIFVVKITLSEHGMNLIRHIENKYLK